MMRKGWLFAALLFLWSACAGTFWAQEGSAQAPSTTGEAASSTASQTEPGQTVAPGPGSDTNQPPSTAERMTPLSGALTLTPGVGGATQSYLLPSFGWTGYADTNPTGFNRSTTPRTQSTYNGSLTLQRIGRHSQLNLSYQGGASWYNQPFPAQTLASIKPYSFFHELGLFEQVSTSRWKWLVGDQGMYLPQSPLGFSGFGGMTSFGGGLGGSALAKSPALGTAFSPDQSIATGLSRRLGNTALTQIEYDASGRSTITATASYGTLQFLDPGFLDSRYMTFMAGYNHILGPRDEVAVTYAHYYFKFSGPNRELLDRGFAFSYGHQISGRLSLQISVSPLVHQIAKPLGGSITQSFVSTSDSLQFRSRKWDAMLSFARIPTGGAGILPGAETDLARANLGRQLSRKIRGSLEFSHAYSQSAVQQSSLAVRSKYEYWEAGASLSREFGPHLSTYLDYSAQRQISNTPLCVGGNCTTVFLRQVGGIGINLHPRPIKIR